MSLAVGTVRSVVATAGRQAGLRLFTIKAGDWPQPRPNAKRYKGPAQEAFTAAQKKIHDDILANRSTGIRGPFRPWLANPEICDPAQQLGHVLRYDIKSLSFPERELAILTVARLSNCAGEWAIHVPEARKSGLTDAAIEAVQSNAEGLPEGVVLIAESSEGITRGILPMGSEHRLQTVYAFVRSLAQKQEVSDELYAAAVEDIGEVGTMELVVLVGYYTMVAMTVNVFNVPQ
eukprot:EG_transcript_17359